jgi:hypothetical protein
MGRSGFFRYGKTWSIRIRPIRKVKQDYVVIPKKANSPLVWLLAKTCGHDWFPFCDANSLWVRPRGNFQYPIVSHG